jgi:hypothetical protein
MTPKSTECMIISSVTQCQAMKTVMNAVREIPEMMVVLRDWSKVKTRWRTVVVAMSMERSSPGRDVSQVYVESDLGRSWGDFWGYRILRVEEETLGYRYRVS